MTSFELQKCTYAMWLCKPNHAQIMNNLGNDIQCIQAGSLWTLHAHNKIILLKVL